MNYVAKKVRRRLFKIVLSGRQCILTAIDFRSLSYCHRPTLDNPPQSPTRINYGHHAGVRVGIKV